MLRFGRILALLVAVLSASNSRGELPPDVYRKLQSSAPEALVVTITKVKIDTKTDRDSTLSSVAAEARVKEVQRSATQLKRGAVIRISYERRDYKRPMPGPSEPDVVEKGRTYPAFLRKENGGSYTLAARGFSFRKM